MISSRLLTALCLAAATSAGAQPLILPGARFEPSPVSPPSSGGVPAQTAPAPPPKGTPVKVAREEDVIGRDLKRNGSAGTLRLERSAGGLSARVVLEGLSPGRAGQACIVRVADGAPLPLTARGRPMGMARYSLEAPACPLAFDILDGAVLVREPTEACLFEQADCRVDVRGLWGPEPGTLAAESSSIEQTRGEADKIVRDNYRALARRASPVEQRTIIAEQASFSAEREMTCRDYAREGTHGFCHARVTQARAASLASRLGLDAEPAKEARPRRRAPRPAPEAQATGAESTN